MSVHKRGTSYEVRWRQGGQQRSRAFARSRDAVSFDLEVRRRRQAGGVIDLEVGTLTLAQWMEEWWRVYAIPNLKPATRKTYAHIWSRHIVRRLGRYELREITPALVDDFRAQLHAARVGDPTIIKALGILQALMKRAAVRGHVSSNPVLLVDKPRQRPGRVPAPLPPLTVERMRGRVGQRDATLLSLLAYAGLRPAEATGLRWRDLSDRTIDVEDRKRGRRRPVRLLGPVAQDLAEWRLASGRPPASQLIFPRPHGGEWTVEDWRNWRRRVYQPAARACGVSDDMRAYRLRGSFVSLLLWEGRSVVYAAEQAGHSVAVLSVHYAGVLEELETATRVPADTAIRQARAIATGQTSLLEAGGAS